MSLTSTVNTVTASNTLTQQSTISNNNTQEIKSAIANQATTAEPSSPSTRDSRINCSQERQEEVSQLNKIT